MVVVWCFWFIILFLVYILKFLTHTRTHSKHRTRNVSDRTKALVKLHKHITSEIRNKNQVKRLVGFRVEFSVGVATVGSC